MRPYRIKIGPGQTVEIGVSGNYVRVADAIVALTLETIDYQNEVTLEEGEEVMMQAFQGLRLSHDDSIEQEFVFYVAAGGKIGSSKTSGAVALKNEQGAFTQGRASVTNAAALLLAAKADRRYLLIQNNDEAATLRITFDGSAPTAAAGFRVMPGESLEMAGFLCSGEVKAITEAATATADNVEFCEG